MSMTESGYGSNANPLLDSNNARPQRLQSMESLVMSPMKKSFRVSTVEIPESGAPSVRSEPPAAGPGWRFYAAFACLCVVNLVCALDATSLAVAVPTVAKALHGTGIEAFWSGTSFLLTATVFQPTFASLSHVFGRKLLLLMALTFFTIGAVLAALAHNFAVLLLGRSIQGVGGGGISALTYVIVTDMVTLRDRGKWFGLITMQWAFGSVTGPVIGGALAEKVSWRWIFWLNIPFCAIGFVMISLFLRLNHVRGHLMEKLRKMDWVGSFLFIASTTSFLIPITWGGVMYDWNSWRTLVPLVLGIAGILAFALWSKCLPTEPILRGSMFKEPTALVSYFGTVIHGLFLGSVLYYMPLYFEGAKGFAPVKAGIALFPWTFTTGPAAVVVGILIGVTGRYCWAIWCGWCLTVTGIGLMTLFTASTPSAEWIGLSLVSGLGLGMLYPAMSFSIQAAASNKDLPFAAALYSFFRNFGQMMGVAVGGTIFQNSMKKRLLSYADLAPFAVQYSKDASALVKVIKAMPPSETAMKANLVTAYVDALRVVWIVMCALASVALVLSVLFTKGFTLERELETEQGFRAELKPMDQER